MYYDLTSTKERLTRPIPKYLDLIRAILGVSIAVLALVYTVSLIEENVVKNISQRNLAKYGNPFGFQPIK